jgi:hypothetical protein
LAFLGEAPKKDAEYGEERAHPREEDPNPASPLQDRLSSSSVAAMAPSLTH